MLAATDETVGTATVARLIGISEGRIRQLANAGVLPVVSTRLGRTYQLRAVERLAQERRARDGADSVATPAQVLVRQCVGTPAGPAVDGATGSGVADAGRG